MLSDSGEAGSPTIGKGGRIMTSQHEDRFTSGHKAQGLELDRQMAARAARMEYILPLVMLAGGFIIGAGWPAVTVMKEDGPLGAMLVLAVYAVMLSISVVIGLAALVITCRLFGTGAGQLWLGLLKLAGVFSLLLIAAALLSGLGCWGSFILLAVMAGMIAWQFDLEMVEGAVAALVCWLIFIGMNIIIFLILSG